MNKLRSRIELPIRSWVLLTMLLVLPAAQAYDLKPMQPSVPSFSVTTTAAGPSISMASPASLMRGNTYTLILTGQNLNQRVKVSFGEGIAVGAITPMNQNMMQVSVTVMPGAPLGPHPVVMTYGNQRQSGPAMVTVVNASAPPVSTIGASQGSVAPPATAGAAAPGSSGTAAGEADKTRVVPGSTPPVSQVEGSEGGIRPPIAPTMMNANLFNASPSQWQRGKSYLLSLGGLNLASGMELDLGEGIKIDTPVLVFNPGQGQVRITVSATANPGQRILRIRENKLQPWRSTPAVGWVSSLDIHAVSSGKVRPKLTEIKPDIAFKKGVIILDKPDRYVPLDVGASKDTAFLLHDAVVFEWHEKNPGLADYYVFRILKPDGKVLITKRIESKLLGHYQAPPDYFKPDAAFLDALLNPAQGPAQVSTGTRGTLTGTKSAVKPSATAVSGQPGVGVSLSDAGVAAVKGYPEGTELLWEVAGYHVYNSSGSAVPTQSQVWGEPIHVAAASGAISGIVSTGSSSQSAARATEKPQPVEIEVEISDRWPLKRPNRPNGFGTCPLDGSQSLLSVDNRDRGIDDTKVNAVNYVGDEMLITGRIDLSSSPYTSFPDETQYSVPYTPPSGQQSAQPGSTGSMPFIDVGLPTNQVIDHKFDNLFVDWGDGTVVPLHLKAGSAGAAYGNNFDRSEVMELPTAKAYADYLKDGTSPYPEFFTHQYAAPGTYPIRVYQLSEGDVQNANPSMLNAASVLGQSDRGGGIKASTGNPYFQVGLATGQLPNVPGKEIADRAYVLYCHPMKIEPFKDPVAFGELWLDKVEIVGFGAPKASASAAAKISGTKASKPGVGLKAAGGTGIARKSAQGNLALSNKPLPAIAGQLSSDVDAVCSGCNKAFTAHAVLSYYGTGDIEAVWNVRLKSAVGRVMKVPQALTGSGPMHVPASPAREGNPKEEDWGEPNLGSFDLYSPPLPVDPAAVYEVWVEVRLAKDAFSKAAFEAMKSYQNGYVPAARASEKAGRAPKLGVLRPSNEGGGGAPPVLYADTAQLVSAAEQSGYSGKLSEKTSTGAAWKKLVPEAVTSDSKKYRVTAIDPDKPCQFYFPGQQGDRFPVYLDDQNIPQDSNGSYSGNGTLGLTLAGNSAASDIGVGISFQGWQVDKSGNVANGTVLKRQASRQVSPAGMIGTLSAIDGVAGQKMDVTMNLAADDSLFRKQGSSEPIRWQATAPLRESGDWIAKASVPLAALGWTGFYLKSPEVTLDISKAEGDKPARCPGTSGPAWTGVHLGHASVEVNTMDLVTVNVPVDDWGIVNGVCGALDLVNDPRVSNLTVGKGTVSFDRIRFNAGNHKMDAHYTFSAHLPWLEVDLKAEDVPLLPEEAAFDFADVKPAGNVSRTFGPVRMDVPKASFRFGHDAGGWRAVTDPVMTFKAEGKDFLPSPLTVPDMRFGMDGRAWFDAQASSSKEIPISGAASLGKTKFDLSSVSLVGGTTSDDRLAVSFHGKLNLSKALPASDVQVDYRISGDQYAGTGPFNAPFLVKTAFPPGQPTAEATIKPEYAPTSGQETRYLGVVDLGLFGGPPIKGEFLLGYQGSDDYWLTRVAVPLGNNGVPLYPPYLKLYQIRGGLGYNMALDAFKDGGTLENAKSSIGAGSLFMAGLQVGSYDHFAFTLDGDFTIAPNAGGGRMDFRAWLLKQQHGGNGDFQGYFQYAGGNFDGRLWGSLGLFNNAILFQLGNSESNAAVDLHVGGGWHLYAGKREGPRIKATVLSVAGADSYMMLGSEEGLLIGGGAHLYLGVGDSSVTSAYVKGYMDMGLQITPQPHAAGDFGAGVEAGVCVVGGCESMGVNASVHAEALPVNVKAHATVEFPWPLPDVSFNVHM